MSRSGAILVMLTVTLTACASRVVPAHLAAHVPATPAAQVQLPSKWPNPADFNTIKLALAVRDQELFHERDWRRQSYGARLAMTTLLSLDGHLLPGRCAVFVNGLYDELWSLFDNYRGENWQPLKVWVRHDPSLRRVCLAPGRSTVV